MPIYFGYEKVLESSSYLKELQGGRKKQESPFGLLRVLGQLRQPYGRVQVNIGEPLKLSEFLDRETPEWRRTLHDIRPPWLTRAVPRLGLELGLRINAAAALNSVNLCALVLLATPHQAIEAELIERQLMLLVTLQRDLPGGAHRSLPDDTPRDWLAEAAWLGFIERRPQALGELILANRQQATLLTWYRNNVQHLFALPALVAFAFRNNPRFDLETLNQRLAPAWPLVAREQFASLPAADFRQALGVTLDTLTRHGLLERHNDSWQRPAELSVEAEQLQLLGRLAQPTLERGYLLLAALLSRPSASLTREELEEHSHQLAERLTLLSGLNAPEFFDRRLFSGLLDTLESEGWLWQENAKLAFDSLLQEALTRSRSLFDPALRHRLLQIAQQHEAGEPKRPSTPSPETEAHAQPRSER